MANGTKNAGEWTFIFSFAQQARNKKERNQCSQKFIR